MALRQRAPAAPASGVARAVATLRAAAWAAPAVVFLNGCGSAPPAATWSKLPPGYESGSPTGPGATANTPPGEPSPPVVGRLSPQQAADVSFNAMALVGTPYKYGGNTPEGGFDCSGLIGYVYRRHAGIVPPRTTAELSFWGQSVPAEQLRAGDLVLFGKGSLANHAGIYVGQDRFVHAPSSGGTVRLDRLSSAHWKSQNPRYRRP